MGAITSTITPRTKRSDPPGSGSPGFGVPCKSCRRTSPIPVSSTLKAGPWLSRVTNKKPSHAAPRRFSSSLTHIRTAQPGILRIVLVEPHAMPFVLTNPVFFTGGDKLPSDLQAAQLSPSIAAVDLPWVCVGGLLYTRRNRCDESEVQDCRWRAPIRPEGKENRALTTELWRMFAHMSQRPSHLLRGSTH